MSELPVLPRRDIAALRERLATMGGLPMARAVRRDQLELADGEASQQARQPCNRPSPRALGFLPEERRSGVAWVRRVSVDLAPFLERADAPAPVRPAQLLRLCGMAPPDAPPPSWDEDAVTVLDIESLGLRGSGVVPFLIGLGTPAGPRLEIDQLLLADPGAEGALLEALVSRLAGCRALVTYNGRSFDLPVLLARCVINRRSAGPLDELLHCDLLTPVRRLFRDRLGACSLRRAEVELLGLDRVDDVPGYEAPLRYQRWLRGDGAALLAGVIRHNELDLCSTMVLGARMGAHLEGLLVAPFHAGDHYRLAMHLEREGVQERVEQHYRDAMAAGLGPWDRQAAHRLARRFERGLDHGAAADAYYRLWTSDHHDFTAARRLCIVLERAGRLLEAVGIAAEAEQRVGMLPAWWEQRLRGRPAGGWSTDFARRRERLDRRVARQTRQTRRGGQRAAATTGSAAAGQPA